jgi:tetratricopeptide (TPR) repeat protein
MCRVLRISAWAACVVIAGMALAGAARAQGPARVWEAPLAIPTYELGPPNPYPTLLDYGRRKWRPVYPYPFLDDLTHRRVEKSYKAVYLENEYLRVTVLPELGGHLYAIFDKTANRDVLYTNHAVKYALVAIRGAWVSGGVEWNFPDGHTLTTVSPIDYATRTEPDGSASVAVGDTERVQGMQWQVVIRLRPGRKDVETEVTLNNRRVVPGRYWYWSTAAAPATDDLRFVYPMREAYPHAYWPVYQFPKEKGVDIGTYREVTNYLSLFARDSLRDFFGVYYEKSDWGIVHVADHREVPGKKIWTWGTDEAGRVWIDKLTDEDGQYVEFQAGRFETQIEHEFIAPHRVERFTEHWYPVDRLGGAWDEATRDAAIRVTVRGGRATIVTSANARFAGAEITVEAGGRPVRSERVDLDPAKALTTTVDLPAEASGQSIAVVVETGDGRQLIRYRTDTLPDANPDFVPAARPVPEPRVATSAEQAYVEGLAADKKSREFDSRPLYEEALRRDPGFAPAHVALGLSYYRTGEYDTAAAHFEKALARDKDAADARYYLALVRRAQGRTAEAGEHLTWAAGRGQFESASLYVLGEIALAAGRTNEALDRLARSVSLDPRDLKARAVLALAERVAGRKEQASRRVDAVVDEMRIDYLALSEQRKVSEELGRKTKADRAKEELWRLLAREPDSVLELAFDYVAAGRPGEARGVLEEAVSRAEGGRVHPMIHYTLGHLYGLARDARRAGAHYALGAAGDPALVFPHRVEEIEVLRAALAVNPKDGRAAYYLGNALASKYRGEEALAAWRDAVRLDPSNVVARRNLARALSVVAKRNEESAAEYERALSAAPNDDRLYLEYAGVLAQSGAFDRVVKLVESAPQSVRAAPPVGQALAAAYADLGRYADAAAELARHEYTTGEGEAATLALYRRAHIGLARTYAKAGDHAKAAAEYLLATEYPRYLGMGRPGMESLAREYVAAARELEAAGRKQEAEPLWQRAASEPLNSPTQPEEHWSEHYFYKAVALEHVGSRDEARALYERLARLADEEKMREAEPSPPIGAIRFALAGAGLKALGRTAEARAALEQAVALDPKGELALIQLAELGRAATVTAIDGTNDTADARRARLVDANVIATHAYQVLLARKSGKGDAACYAPGKLSDAQLEALVAHQRSLLRSDLAAVAAWARGEKSAFDAAKDLEPILASGLTVPEGAPVDVFAGYLARVVKNKELAVRSVASLYQTVMEVERDGDLLQDQYALYIALGLPVYVGQLGLPGDDAAMLEVGRALAASTCASPFETDAAAWQIAGRKVWNWGEKNLHLRDEKVLAAELLREPEVRAILPRVRAMPARRIAVVGHSFTMGLHWASPSAFVPIVAEILERENPRVEIRQFAGGGLTASRARDRFYKDVLAWKPDAVLFVVIERTDADYEALAEMGRGLAAAGASVSMFDNIYDPEAVKPGALERAVSVARGAGIAVIPVGKAIESSPERAKFLSLDHVHMTEPYHRLMAREWLAYLAAAPANKP